MEAVLKRKKSSPKKEKSKGGTKWDFPGGSDGKEYVCNAGDPGSIPRSGRSTAEGNSNPLQYSCLKNPMDGGAWWAIVHAVTNSGTRLKQLSMHAGTKWFDHAKSLLFPFRPRVKMLGLRSQLYHTFSGMVLNLSLFFISKTDIKRPALP